MSHGNRRRIGRLRPCCALLLALAGCDSRPVDWTMDRSGPAPSEAVVLFADGHVAADSLANVAMAIRPPSSMLCRGSLRLARAGTMLYGVWWSPRGDSSAGLLSAHSPDRGATWSAPSPVNTTDRAVNGCRREPPSIAADSANGYVHVAYPLMAPEGPGLFFSHSMDGGATFHAPVPIVYGDHLGRTSIAADGDLVAVAFEDPNSRMPRIGLALSRTMGHIFEQRLLPVSHDIGEASHPLVAVHAHRVAIAWEQRAAADAPAALAVRVGVIR